MQPRSDGMTSVLAVNPTSVTVGDSFTITGSGYGSRRTVYVYSNGYYVFKFRATTSGTFTRTMYSELPTGPHVIKATDTLGNTASATVQVNAVPTPSPEPTPPPPTGHFWGLIGNDGTHLVAERTAGITAKLLELNWSSYEPTEGAFSAGYISAKKTELVNMRAAGFNVILGLGIQYPPTWLHNYPDSYYIDGTGLTYTDSYSGAANVNLIWNDALRAKAATYIGRVFTDLGNFYAVRLGGGHYGELGHPYVINAATGKPYYRYYAFDANANTTNPVPAWRPGQSSPTGEAQKFSDWYQNRLVNFENWQVATVRLYYPGTIQMLYPGFGIRPGQLAAAVSGNLSGTTSAEINGEVSRGYDYARQVAGLTQSVQVYSTWLECEFGNDASTSAGDGSPMKYLAYLADLRGYPKGGENSGNDYLADMTRAATRMRDLGLAGMVWFNESQIYGGTYASLANYQTTIGAFGP